MKKTLLFSIALMVGTTAYAATDDNAAPEETHRSLQFQMTDVPKKSFVDRCLLTGKGLGAGAIGTLFGCLCIGGTQKGGFECLMSKEVDLFKKAGVVCLLGVAALLAAKMGGDCFENMKNALKG